MKIFLIEHNFTGYDYFAGHVIVANNENEVRELAQQGSGSEGDGIWDIATIHIVGNYTGNETEPFILLSDFYAG